LTTKKLSSNFLLSPHTTELLIGAIQIAVTFDFIEVTVIRIKIAQVSRVYFHHLPNEIITGTASYRATGF